MKNLASLTEYVKYPCHLDRLEWIAGNIKNMHNQSLRILDVGCGTGNITIPLASIEGTQITGIDVHQGNLEMCKAKNNFPNLEFHYSNFNECNISNFDIIILTEVLEHIPDYCESIFEHLEKQARNSVSVYITIPNGYGLFELSMQPLYFLRKLKLHAFIDKIKGLMGKKEPYSLNYDTPHVNFFTLKRLKKDLKHYGFYLEAVHKSFIISPVIETYLPFVPLRTISIIDKKIASLLPSFIASGWYLIIKKNPVDTAI